MERFTYVQVSEEYTDYETSLDRVEAGTEKVRRLTIVRRSGEKPWAYLTMEDYTEQRITIETAEALLKQEC